MALYFFHLHKAGQIITDPEGTHLPTIGEACQEALFAARELIINRLRNNKSVSMDDYIAVADENGTVLHKLTFRDALAKC
jgi:hypothetical protein